MNLPDWPGWYLLGAFPDGEPDDVGSWLLHHGGEALLLEVPPGLTPAIVRDGLARLGGPKLRYLIASHDHEDHLDADSWNALAKAFPRALPIHPACLCRGDTCLSLGGEPLWLLKAPKHSQSDVVTVFRGAAMTGDIELGMLASVNDEVDEATRRQSMKYLRKFPGRTGYRVHSIVSAHLNDVRAGVDWPALFRC